MPGSTARQRATASSGKRTNLLAFHLVNDLRADLEWRLTYVGNAESEEYDQVLDSVLVGPVFPGQYRFVFQVRSGRLQQSHGPHWSHTRFGRFQDSIVGSRCSVFNWNSCCKAAPEHLPCLMLPPHVCTTISYMPVDSEAQNLLARYGAAGKPAGLQAVT